MKTALFACALLASGFIGWKYKPVAHLPGKENKPVTTAPKQTVIPPVAASPTRDNTRIQVALLLDTSNSMDGLIDQAKSRLWNIVNTLTTLKYQGKTPAIEIALYEYGNYGLSAESGYIRQVASLTTDLDLISEKLFSLKTNGGDEYCGAVISNAVKTLPWGHGESDMKLIYIAGNEPFTQGEINYINADGAAASKNIFVNTIFCGSRDEGIATKWKDGADKGHGKYFNIDPDKKVVFIETPYDDKIAACNTRMNATYIGYGYLGDSKKMNQEVQDKNALSQSGANSVERFVSKANAAYVNTNWDLVDLNKKDPSALKSLNKEDLPVALRGKSAPELQRYVVEKTAERDSIQQEITALGKQRQQYIDEKLKKNSQEKGDDLGTAIKNSIITLANSKGYTTGQ